DGGGFGVVEALDWARARGATILGEIVGTAWRALPSRPHGIGTGADSKAIAAALAEAGAGAEEIGHVYTSASGDAERAAWEEALLDRALAPHQPPRRALRRAARPAWRLAGTPGWRPGSSRLPRPKRAMRWPSFTPSRAAAIRWRSSSRARARSASDRARGPRPSARSRERADRRSGLQRGRHYRRGRPRCPPPRARPGHRRPLARRTRRDA